MSGEIKGVINVPASEDATRCRYLLAEIHARVRPTGLRSHECLIQMMDMGQFWDGKKWFSKVEYTIKPIEPGFRVLSDWMESSVQSSEVL